jgi:hypothetical protein
MTIVTVGLLKSRLTKRAMFYFSIEERSGE